MRPKFKSEIDCEIHFEFTNGVKKEGCLKMKWHGRIFLSNPFWVHYFKNNSFFGKKNAY